MRFNRNLCAPPPARFCASGLFSRAAAGEKNKYSYERIKSCWFSGVVQIYTSARATRLIIGYKTNKSRGDETRRDEFLRMQRCIRRQLAPGDKDPKICRGKFGFLPRRHIRTYRGKYRVTIELAKFLHTVDDGSEGLLDRETATIPRGFCDLGLHRDTYT